MKKAALALFISITLLLFPEGASAQSCGPQLKYNQEDCVEVDNPGTCPDGSETWKCSTMSDNFPDEGTCLQNCGIGTCSEACAVTTYVEKCAPPSSGFVNCSMVGNDCLSQEVSDQDCNDSGQPGYDHCSSFDLGERERRQCWNNSANNCGSQQCTNNQQCVNNTYCCTPGVDCPGNGQCASGLTQCGTKCCRNYERCEANSYCCTPGVDCPGDTPPQCEAGLTQCGSKCCYSGQQCIDSAWCCTPGHDCPGDAPPVGGNNCPAGKSACGTNGLCCDVNTEQCINSNTCCKKGVNCPGDTKQCSTCQSDGSCKWETVPANTPCDIYCQNSSQCQNPPKTCSSCNPDGGCYTWQAPANANCTNDCVPSQCIATKTCSSCDQNQCKYRIVPVSENCTEACTSNSQCVPQKKCSKCTASGGCVSWLTSATDNTCSDQCSQNPSSCDVGPTKYCCATAGICTNELISGEGYCDGKVTAEGQCPAACPQVDARNKEVIVFDDKNMNAKWDEDELRLRHIADNGDPNCTVPTASFYLEGFNVAASHQENLTAQIDFRCGLARFGNQAACKSTFPEHVKDCVVCGQTDVSANSDHLLCQYGEGFCQAFPDQAFPRNYLYGPLYTLNHEAGALTVKTTIPSDWRFTDQNYRNYTFTSDFDGSSSGGSRCEGEVLIPVYNPRRECVIRTSTGYSTQGARFGVAVNGYAKNGNFELMRGILSKADYSPITNSQGVEIVPTGATKITIDGSDGLTYYQISNLDTGLNNGLPGQGVINDFGADLPAGDYYFHCDINSPNSSVPPVRCSGNPAHSYEEDYGGLLEDPTWQSCHNRQLPNEPTDNTKITINCSPQCTNQCGGDDGCGGTCDDSCLNTTPSTPSNMAPQTSPQPDGAVFPKVHMNGANTAQIKWDMTGTCTFNYKVVVYETGAYANPLAAELSGASDVVIEYVNAPQYSYDAVEEIGSNITVSVKAISACNASSQSGWLTQDIQLVDTISGTFYVTDDPASVNTSTCMTLNKTAQPVPNHDNLSTIGTTTETKNLNGLQTIYSVLAAYDPASWTTSKHTVSLVVSNDPNDTQLTCTCGGQSPTQCERISIDSPATNVDFILSELPYDSWWSAVGGLGYAQGGMISPLPNSSVNTRYLFSNAVTALVEPLSGGIPTAGGTIVPNPQPNDNGGRYSSYQHNNLDANLSKSNSSAAGTDHSQLPDKDYEYYASRLSFSNYSAASELDNTIDDKADIQNDKIAQELDDGTKILWKNSDLTIDPTDTIEIEDDEKYIMFVDGDITFETGSVESLVTVETGGFIAFIASGDIIFDTTVGFDLDAGPTPVIGTDSTVEGVFIANTIRIETLGDSDKDKKFIGEGSFIGWSNIDLARSYDDNGFGRVQNETDATEVFVYRPDLLINTPEIMFDTNVLWQEVN